MMAVVVVIWKKFALTVSENNTGHMPLVITKLPRYRTAHQGGKLTVRADPMT